MLNNLIDKILIVEDSEEDYYATRRIFEHADIKHLYRCSDGQEALDFLFHEGKYKEHPESAPRQSLILLDLNLPKKDGREILRIVKGEKTLKSIPIIVLTTSSDNRDIESCYEYGANTYIQKPVELEDFNRAIQSIKSYWFETSLFPKEK